MTKKQKEKKLKLFIFTRVQATGKYILLQNCGNNRFFSAFEASRDSP